MIGKSYKVGIEQDNSNTRHYLGRLRRSKITSRSVEMVDLSLILLYFSNYSNFSINNSNTSIFG